MKVFIAWLIWVIIFYILASIVAWNFNIGTWHPVFRLGYVILVFIVSGFYIFGPTKRY